MRISDLYNNHASDRIVRWVITGPVYPYRGGIAHFTTALAKAAGDQHDVYTVSFSRLYPQLFFPGSSTKDPSASPQRVDTFALLDSLNPISWRQVAEKIRDIQPQLAIFQWWTTFLAPCFGLITYWLKRWDIPVIYIIHNVLPHEPGPLDRWITKKALSHASGYVLLSEHERQRLISIFPLSSQRTVVYPHPVYEHIPKAAVTREVARRHLELPESKSLLLFFGFVRPYKGVLPLLESLATLKKNGQSVFLVIAGEIWHDSVRYRNEVERLDIQDCVRFDNRYIPDEEVPLYFAAADLFVAPYLRGTQSGSLRIAVNHDIPMVVSQQLVEGLESIQPGRLLAVPPGDVPALTAAIAQQLERSKITAIPENRIEKTATWDQLVWVISDLARSIAGRS